ncbi:MAG: molybdopterin-dependent oxidoreductase [Thermoanaerobaculia bacterium]
MPEVEIRRTTCPMDCPDTCALEVAVEEGRIRSIGGSRDHPDTAGFICSKVAAFGRRLEHPDRLLHPMRRIGAKGEARFERISWDEAVSEIAERLTEVVDRWGGEAVLPFHYGGSNGKLTDELLDALFFARLGASRLDKTICAVPASAVATGMYGKMPGVAFGDYPEARCIVVWGANTRGSNIHLAPALKEARRRGAFVAVVDPRRTFAREDTDLHLPVLPGQDLPLALALIGELERLGALDREFIAEHTHDAGTLLERAAQWPVERAAREAGVEADAIRRLAAVWAESSPAVVRCGWGLERNANGAQAIAAVLALPALTGKFGVRGGGYTLSNNGKARFDRDAVLGPVEWSTRSLNMTQLGRLLAGRAPVPGLDPTVDEPLDPPIRALFVYNANPAVTVPDQEAVLAGLAREDLFTVVHEQVMTDTARYADVLLPAVTFLEGHDLRVSYGSYVVGGVVPVVEPAGEARSNMRLFAALARAMGFGDRAFEWSDEELLRRAADAVSMPGGPADGKRMAQGLQQRYDFPGGTPIQMQTVVPQTPDGRIHLVPESLGPRPYDWRAPATDGSLALISPASPHLITSTMGEYNLDRLTVTLHPEDAAERGLTAGRPVRVFNTIGEVHCHLAVSDAVRRGVASMPKGAWRRSSLNGKTSTALCPDDAQVVGDAACFNDARVEVAAL